MRLLSLGPGGVLLVQSVVILIVIGVTTASVQAHPDPKPDHGINESTFHRLWSGDADGPVNDMGDMTAIKTLARMTDFPMDVPPSAVDQWNRGEFETVPRTDHTRSIYPGDASLTDGEYIADAYAEIVSISPSTRAQISTTERPLYVASNGTLLGMVDYRVRLPDDELTPDRSITWHLDSHRITETRLVIDGAVEQTAKGTQTPVFSVRNLGLGALEQHTLALEAEIEGTVERRVVRTERRCDRSGNTTTCWTVETETSTQHTESMTVRDSMLVTAYDLRIGGFIGTYPNGNLGLVVYKNHPWLGYTHPAGRVHGVWRFYSARDSDWDYLYTSTESGVTASHSSMHPLQVVAYPIESGATASPARRVRILETYGIETTPPSLPANVHLDVLTEPYPASYGIATRIDTTDHNQSSITAHGLVRGVSVHPNASTFTEIPINRSDLTLAILNRTTDTVTVHIQLRDAVTGAAINTNRRAGSIVLDGERVNTAGNGTVTMTIPRPAGGIVARYEPGPWWYTNHGYVGDSDIVYVRGTVLSVFSILYRIGIPVALFLLGVFLIDRITGWSVWPPWRRM